MRIVLDTNVAFSALLWRGLPYDFLQITRRHHRVRLFSSDALLQELGEVLTRPTSMKRLVLIGLSAADALAAYSDAVERVTPLSIEPVIAADPDDDEVIAAAVAAGADMIVSGDRHLLDLGNHQGIHIVTVSEAMRLLVSP